VQRFAALFRQHGFDTALRRSMQGLQQA
jgi:hypothetical protein